MNPDERSQVRGGARDHTVTLMWFDHETGKPSPEFSVVVSAIDTDHAVQLATSIADPEHNELWNEHMELELRGVREGR